MIVDYIMPEMNGHEVAIELRRLRPQVPIIMLSGAVDVPEQALKCVHAFIAKGQVASQLLPTIAQLLEDRCSSPDGAMNRDKANRGLLTELREAYRSLPRQFQTNVRQALNALAREQAAQAYVPPPTKPALQPEVAAHILGVVD